jgi:hypothetical protein
MNINNERKIDYISTIVIVAVTLLGPILTAFKNLSQKSFYVEYLFGLSNMLLFVTPAFLFIALYIFWQNKNIILNNKNISIIHAMLLIVLSMCISLLGLFLKDYLASFHQIKDYFDLNGIAPIAILILSILAVVIFRVLTLFKSKRRKIFTAINLVSISTFIISAAVSLADVA